MAKKDQAHKHEGNELLENPEVLAEHITRSEQFVEKNKVAVFTLMGIVALAVTAIFMYRYYLNNQNKLANDEMFQAIYYFEQDSLDLALRGDGNRYGFLDITEEYSGTDAANLANFYVGAIYMQKANYNGAVLHLEDFSSSDVLMQARAYSLLGDAYMEQDDYASAANYYQKAADHQPNEYFTPQYLLKAGLAYEKTSNFKQAAASYETIVSKYNKSTEADKAKKYKARLKGKS